MMHEIAEPPFEREFDLSLGWVNQPVDTTLTTTDGRSVRVLFRGTWTHGFGPDFRGAMLLFGNGELVSGDVEIHARTSGWRAHGHHLDVRYDPVILHVVARDDGGETRRRDGAIVPVAVMPEGWLDTQRPATDWSIVGGEVCAPDLARSEPTLIRDLLWRLGDMRLAERVARFEREIVDATAAQVLYRSLWDGLGYAMNREPMVEVANRLPIGVVEQRVAVTPADDRFESVLALQLGVAGFLPLADVDVHLGGITDPGLPSRLLERWLHNGSAWHDLAIPPSAWTRARVRPANHPVARLVAGAAMIANATDGLLTTLLRPIRMRTDPVVTLRALSIVEGSPRLGGDRGLAMTATTLIPFAMALGLATDDDELRDGASAAWEALPASAGNEVTRRARRQIGGDARFLPAGGRGEQGLLHLDRTLCTPRRCHECPVASAVLASRRSEP